MIRDRLERIRERAYALWERAGGGHGEDETHWRQASSEIDEEDAGAPRRKGARRSPAKAAVSAEAPAAAPKRPGRKPKAAVPVTADAPETPAAAPARRGRKPKPKPESVAATSTPVSPAAKTRRGAKQAEPASTAALAPVAKPGRKASAAKASPKR